MTLMKVEIRLYKIYDADLIALGMAGYSLSNMMRDAIIAFANGMPLHYYIDRQMDTDFNNMKSVHTRFVIPDKEEKAIYMIKNIKHRCRNMFCKAVLRDALIQQNLSVFFSTESAPYLLPLIGKNAGNRNVMNFINVKPVSSLEVEERQITFEGKTVKSATDNNPFSAEKKAAAFINMVSAPVMDMPVQKIPVTIPSESAGYTPAQQMQEMKATPLMPQPEEVKEISPIPSALYEEQGGEIDDTIEDIKEDLPVQEIVQTEKTNEPADTSVLDALDKLMGNDFE